MANHASAIKRSRQNEIRRLRNKVNKTKVKHSVKDVRAAIVDNDSENAAQKLKAAQAVIDKAAKKGVLHKNTAARKISRLSRQLNSLK